MLGSSFSSHRLLRSIRGTEPFAEFCRQRAIVFPPRTVVQTLDEIMGRWTEAVKRLPPEQQARVEMELAQVQELSGRSGIALLLEVADGLALPPNSVPSGAPLALWFLVHQPALFRDVFLQHEIREVDAWQSARIAAGLQLDLEEKRSALGQSLRDLFGLREGSGRFCAVDAHRVGAAWCFVCHLADRLRILDVFTDAGEHKTARVRPAFRILFAYYPDDGTLLVQSHLRSRQRILELIQRFGQSVLGIDLDERCLGYLFNLEPLKRSFQFLPDAPDMQGVRVKSLHLRYPERSGRRQVKLETAFSDEPEAIEQLLASHFPGRLLSEVCVCYAELQIRMLIDGRPKNYPIRLWPNRCSVHQTPLGDRFRACLKRWGLFHAE